MTSAIKTLALLGATTLTLAAGAAQADFGRPGQPPVNPWLQGTYYQQAQYQQAMKEQLARFDERQEHQLQRILGGMERGKLTLRESTELLREHLAIAALEREYLADGRLGPWELREMEARLDRAGKHIFFEARDDDRVGGGRPGPDRHADYGGRRW